jgi:hypothetical protein
MRSIGKPVSLSLAALLGATALSYLLFDRPFPILATVGLAGVCLLALILFKSRVPATDGSETIDSSRRSLLAGGVAALGAAGATLSLLPADAGARPSRSKDAQRTVKLSGRNWRYRNQDGNARCSGELVGRDGHKIGNFYSTNMGTNAPFEDNDSSGMEFHVFNLANGSLFGMGSGSHLETQEASFSVIGGTGSYAGQTGSYLGSQHSVELGGDGSAEFTFSLGR